MKKTFLLSCAIVIASFSIKAQSITITQSDMPAAGELFIEALDTTFTGLSVGNAGTNQVWNMANLENHLKDTTMMYLATFQPGFANFPTATVAAYQSGGTVSFCSATATAYNMLGMYGDMFGLGSATAIKFNPPQTYVKLPATFGTTNSGTTTYEIIGPFPQPPIDSIRIHMDVTYSSEVDGWGTITTPAFSAIPCIRQRTNSAAVITSYFHAMGSWVPAGTPETDSTISYSWFSKTAHYSLVTIDANADGSISSASYLFSKGTFQGLKDAPGISNAVQIYPNPASNFVHISGVTSASDLKVFDITGKLVAHNTLTAKETILMISDYKPGIYFYQITDLGKNTVSRGKFVVEK
jgi:hypothetical protein